MLFDKTWPQLDQITEFSSELSSTQVKVLLNTVSLLECERNTLINTISDLRQLLHRISAEQERESKRRQRNIHLHQQEINSLQKALKTSETHSASFKCLASYWRENLQ